MLKDENIHVVDVRVADDFAKGHVPGTVNLPKEKWDTAQGFKKDKINVLYCYTQQCHLQRTQRWSLPAEDLQ
jgi:rhodanese-related sulfurtransferase